MAILLRIYSYYVLLHIAFHKNHYTDRFKIKFIPKSIFVYFLFNIVKCYNVNPGNRILGNALFLFPLDFYINVPKALDTPETHS